MKFNPLINRNQQSRLSQNVVAFCVLTAAIVISACGCSSTHQCPFKRNNCNDCDKKKLEELESRGQSTDLTPEAPNPPTKQDIEITSLLENRQSAAEAVPQNGGSENRYLLNASEANQSVYDFHNHQQPDVVQTQPVITQAPAQSTFAASAPANSNFVSVAPSPGQTMNYQGQSMGSAAEQTFAPGSVATASSDHTSLLPAELQATMTPTNTQDATSQNPDASAGNVQLPPELQMQILPTSPQAVPTYDAENTWLADANSSASAGILGATSQYLASDAALRAMQGPKTVTRPNYTSATDVVVANPNAPNNGYVVNYPSVPTVSAPSATPATVVATPTPVNTTPTVAPTATATRANSNSSVILPGLVSGQAYDARNTATPMH